MLLISIAFIRLLVWNPSVVTKIKKHEFLFDIEAKKLEFFTVVYTVYVYKSFYTIIFQFLNFLKSIIG